MSTNINNVGGGNALLLTRKEVAGRLKVCTHTVARLQRRGLLTAVKIGGRLIRYLESDVNNLLEEAKV